MREIEFRLIKDGNIVGYCRWFEGSDYFKPGWEYAKYRSGIWAHELDGGKIKHNKKEQFMNLKDKFSNKLYENDIIKLLCHKECEGTLAKIKHYWDGWWFFTQDETKGRMGELISQTSAVFDENHKKFSKCEKVGNIHTLDNWREVNNE